MRFKLPHAIRCVLAMGRTVPNLQPNVSKDEIDVLLNEYGIPSLSSSFSRRQKIWGSCSPSQKLDLIATEIIAAGRRVDAQVLRGEEKTVHLGAWKGCLSPGQYQDRLSHEIPIFAGDIANPNHPRIGPRLNRNRPVSVWS